MTLQKASQHFISASGHFIHKVSAWGLRAPVHSKITGMAPKSSAASCGGTLSARSCCCKPRLGFRAVSRISLLLLSCGITHAKLKGPSQVGIVELHHHILVHLINARRDGTLPAGKGATLLSFDSHGDFAMPKRWFDPEEVWKDSDPLRILQYTQISDWVPAAIWLGLASRIIFVEPPWGIEFVVRPHPVIIITLGTYNGNEFAIHVRTPNGTDVSKEYANVVGSGSNFVDPDEMDGAVEVEFTTVRLEDIQSKIPKLLSSANARESPMYLSIDMDVFSTESPRHLGILKKVGLPMRVQQLLFEVWRGVTGPQDFQYWSTHMRENQCPTLFRNISYTDATAHALREIEEQDLVLGRACPVLRPLKVNSRTDDRTNVPERDTNIATQLVASMSALGHFFDVPQRELAVKALKPFTKLLETALKRFGFQQLIYMLHQIIFYPLHISSEASSRLLVNAVECVLASAKRLGAVPALINLARSPTFVPIHQLRSVECSLLAALKRLYPSLTHLDFDSAVELHLTDCPQHADFSTHNELPVIDHPAVQHTVHDSGRHDTERVAELVISNLSPSAQLLVLAWVEGELKPLRLVEPNIQMSIAVRPGFNLTVLAKIPDTITVGTVVRGRRVESYDGHTLFWPFLEDEIEAALKQR